MMDGTSLPIRGVEPQMDEPPERKDHTMTDTLQPGITPDDTGRQLRHCRDAIGMRKRLTSQAAISLENTRLYRDLEDREGRIRRLASRLQHHRHLHLGHGIRTPEKSSHGHCLSSYQPTGPQRSRHDGRDYNYG
jgi:hypothetical protein